jgi:hypothetical protein
MSKPPAGFWNDFRPETKALIETLRKHGFTTVGYSNGDDKMPYTTDEDLIEELCGVDESWLYLLDLNQRQFIVYLVLGNSPGELPADYQYKPGADCTAIDAAIEEHYNSWINRPQPLTEVV